MKRRTQKNIKRFLKAQENEIDVMILKNLRCEVKNLNLSYFNYVYFINKTIHNLKKNKFSSHKRSMCLITGRLQSVYQFCRLTRMQIKKIASLKLMTGLRSSSW